MLGDCSSLMAVKQPARKYRAARPPMPRVRKKLWIFDFDNTLVRLEPEVDWAGGRRELEPRLRAQGVPEDLFEKFPRGNLPLYAATRARLLELAANPGSGFSRSQVRAILRDASNLIERYELAGVDPAETLAGGIEFLKRLREQSATIAIVTSNSSRTIRRWLSIHRLDSLIDVLVGRDSLLALKPSPEMIVRVLDICGLPAREAVFVGDADSDYQAATAIDVKFFGIASNKTARAKLLAAGAENIFSSPATLDMHLNLWGPAFPDGHSSFAKSR